MINIAKNVKGESANKLTTPKLIAYNGKMPTNNMIKSKSPEYPCFWICNVDAKIIDWICDWLKLIFQYEANEHRTTKDAKSNNAAQDDEQHNVALRRRNHEKTQKKNLMYVEITYLDWKKGEKRCREVILGQKLT